MLMYTAVLDIQVLLNLSKYDDLLASLNNGTPSLKTEPSSDTSEEDGKSPLLPIH